MLGRARALLLVCLGGASGCSSGSVFACDASDTCVQGDIVGRCEPVGYCSYPDPDCASGRRFGASAGDGLSGQCVDPSGADTGPTTASTGVTTSTSASSTTDATTTVGGTSDPCPGWFDCAWSSRRSLQIVNPTEEALVDVPVRIALDGRRIEYGVAASEGRDLRFVASDDQTVLDHEVERWADDGVTEVWIRIPTLPAGGRATIFMYYGNDAAPDAQNSAGVFSGGFVGVWHLGSAVTDSAGALDLGGVSRQAPGIIAAAQQFDGAGSFLQPNDGSPVVDLFVGGATITAWIQPASFGENGFGRIVDSSADNMSAQGWGFMVCAMDDGVANALRFAHDFDGSRGTWKSGADTITMGSWHFVGISFDANAPTVDPILFIDGTAVPTTGGGAMGNPNAVSTAPLTIGALPDLARRWFDGAIDEVRLSSVQRSPAWIAVQYASMTDALVSYGAAESAPQ